MHRLPNEIWSIIFQATLTSSQYEHPLLSPSYPLFELARVCRQWYTIIVESPAFWCRFTVLDLQPDLGQMNRWLARSEQIALSIEIMHNTSSKIPTLTLITRSDRVLSAVLNRKQKLKRLHITGPAPFELLNQHIAQSLETLSIKSRGHSSSGVSSFVNLPLTRLTELRLELHTDQILGLDGCAVVLSNAPQLQSCYIDALYSGSPAILKISCPALQKLHLLLRNASRAGGRSNLVPFLDALGGCTLKDLGVDWLVEEFEGQSHLEGLGNSLSRWSRSLQSLRLSYLPLSDLEIGKCLTSLASLDFVCLRYPLYGSDDPITYTLIRQLGYRSVHLECTGTRFNDEDLAELFDKVEICYLLTPHRRSDWLREQMGSSQLGFLNY